MSTYDEPEWFHATTLAERLAARPKPRDVASRDADSIDADADDQTEYRLTAWRSQPPFDRHPFLEQRLALDHLTESDLRHFLAEPIDEVQDRFDERPGWLIGLQSVLASPSGDRLHAHLPESLRHKPTAAFLDVAAPFIERALEQLETGTVGLTKAHSSVPFDAATIPRLLVPDLIDGLLEMVGRTIVLEMNVARICGELQGDTPEERFQSYTKHLREPGYVRSVLLDYPVLARQLFERAERWVEVSLELLGRLSVDAPALKSAFGRGTDLGVLVATSGQLADPRRGGRSVVILTFSSGIRIVYKPKSLAVDAHFQELLGWLNARGVEPPFRILTVLDRGTYGWVEHVDTLECGVVEEVQRFYERQGAYLALLYILEATDFHADNVIAAGEQPVLIDLEALFHPQRSRSAPGDCSADRAARKALSNSVLRVGLLPERLWSTSEAAGVDLSGLGTLDGQIAPHGRPHWEAAGTDSMHLVQRRKPIGARKNRPKLAGAGVNVVDYRQSILDGFSAMYSMLRTHRDDLLSETGPLARFQGDEVCVFLRSSRTYRRLLRESYHPDVLRDGLDRDRLFDLLWVEVEDDPDLVTVIRAEREDLLRGDVPVFITHAGSRDLWTSAVDSIPDFFEEPSLSAVHRHLMGLGHEDFARQVWLIQASLATLSSEPIDSSVHPLPLPTVEADRGRLLAAAQAVGDRLETLALRGASGITWIGLSEEHGRWSIAPLGLDLSDGLPGAALFLAYLGDVTGKGKYTRLAEGALATLQGQMKKERDSLRSIGGFDGWGGLIHVLTHLGDLWGRRDLITDAESATDLLPDLILQDEVLNVFGGAAGCIGALRCLHECAPSSRLSTLVTECGDHLVAGLEAIETGGFAYGAAGAAWALFQVYAWTGLDRFRVAALSLTARARNGEQSGLVGTSWCRGASGVGLGRLGSLFEADGPTIRAEIWAALDTTLRRGFGRNHSLGHGDLGHLEFVREASRVCGAPQCQRDCQRLAAAVLASIETGGWRCGTPLGVESPGLMTGLAGIGYGLLRLAEPERVPSILLQEPPPERRLDAA